MRNASFTAIVCLAATLAYTAPAPYPLPVNSRSQTAPPVIAYAGNLNTYRVTLTDGNTASPIVGTEVPFMAWATNNTAAVNSTGVCSVVSGTTGVFDVVFSPASVNFTAGRYIYEVGVKSNGVPRTYRQGTFQIIGSPVGGSVGSVNWTTNLDWSTISWANLPSSIGAAPTDTVARASIATLQGRLVDSVNGSTGAVTVATAAQGAKADTALQPASTNGWTTTPHAAWLTTESDPIALAVMSTQRVTRVWSADGTQFAETGVVWRLDAVVTNFMVTFNDAFSAYIGMTQTNFPFSGHVYNGNTWVGLFTQNSAEIRVDDNAVAFSDGLDFPLLLVEAVPGSYTATVSIASYQYATNVYYTYANQADVTANTTNLANHVATNASSVIAQAQPSTLTRYGDFATTNDLGFAAFGLSNPAEKYISTLAPTNGQSLAKARYAVASAMGGVLSLSAYVKSGPFNPATSNAAAYAVLSVYSAAGAVIASNIGATVSMAAGGISNLSASVTLSAAVTNGYVVAEIISATNAASYVSPYAGGAYPLSLYALSTPLAYLTKAEADARYAAAVNTLSVNPTFGGAVTIGGVARDTWPEQVTAAITNGQSDVLLSNLTVNGGAVFSNDLTVVGGAYIGPTFFSSGGGIYCYGSSTIYSPNGFSWLYWDGSNVASAMYYQYLGAGANVFIPNGSLSVIGTIGIGPAIGGVQSVLICDGTNLYFRNYNYVTNALTDN